MNNEDFDDFQIAREIEHRIKAAVSGIKSIRALPNLQADKAIRYYLTSGKRLQLIMSSSL